MSQIERVRCIDAYRAPYLDHGRTYDVVRDLHNHVTIRGGRLRGSETFRRDRFKPVVRVKAPGVPTLDLMIKRAVAAFDAMTPEEKDAHVKAQRESWVRGQIWD